VLPRAFADDSEDDLNHFLGEPIWKGLGDNREYPNAESHDEMVDLLCSNLMVKFGFSLLQIDFS